MAKRSKKAAVVLPPEPGYDELLIGISDLLERARRMSARSVNSILTTTYWEIGRRVVEFEQGGKARAEYGEGLWKRLAADLTAKYGRGFSKSNLASMQRFPERTLLTVCNLLVSKHLHTVSSLVF